MPYRRPPGAPQADLAASKEFEEAVRIHLPAGAIIRTESTTELDFFVPGVYIEVKEKRQRLGDRWLGPWTHPIEERELFILDELSVRKALLHYPYVWFVLRSVPSGWIRLANISEIVSADRIRFDRNGKGKWVIDTSEMEIVELPDLMDRINQDIGNFHWKQSGCVVPAPEV